MTARPPPPSSARSRRGRVCLAAIAALWLPAASALAAPPAVTFTGAYTAEGFTVADGGLARGSVFRGLLEAGADIDLHAAIAAPVDSRFHASALVPHGGDLSGDLLGDLQGASNIAAYNHPLLYEFWLAAKLAAGRFDVRAGRLVADSDFALTEGGALFLNSSFGWPAFISANTRNTGPAFDRSALGLFAGAQLSPRLRLQAGIYDGDTFDSPKGDAGLHPNGLHLELGHGQGAFAIAEIAAATSFGPADATRPGALKLGAWAHSGDFADQYDPSRQHAGTHGLYVVAEQMLWRASAADAAPALSVFARTGFSPRDRSSVTQTADCGVNFTGLFPGRPADIIGIGGAWARISSAVCRAERAAGATVISDYELAVEATYRIAAGERWTVIPDVQWIRHPGGSSAVRDALVLGLRTRVEF